MASVIGIDCSTQSCTVEVRDGDDGALLSSSSMPLPQTYPPRSEQWPSDWWKALVSAVAGCDVANVRSIAVTGQSHGLVLLDGKNQVLRPAKLWNDTESQGEAEELVDRIGPNAWVERAGVVPKAAFTITKLAWVWKHEPKTASRVARVLLPHDWLTYRLCGSFITDRGEASTTGYFDPARSEWCFSLLDLVDTSVAWTDYLPQVAPPEGIAGELSAAAASELGLKSGIPVTVGTGDQMAGALGLGLSAGEVAVSLGTSGTVYTVHGSPVSDREGVVDGFADATGRFLPLVCTLNAAKVLDATRRLLGVDYEVFSDLILGSQHLGDLTLVPYLDGERSPNLPFSSGLLTGIRSDITPGELARASAEGMLCGILAGYESLVRATALQTPRFLTVTGGGSKSKAVVQVLADLSQLAVVVNSDSDTSARGACVQAAAASNGRKVKDVCAEWRPQPRVTVEPSVAREYSDRRRALYRERARLAFETMNRH